MPLLHGLLSFKGWTPHTRLFSSRWGFKMILSSVFVHKSKQLLRRDLEGRNVYHKEWNLKCHKMFLKSEVKCQKRKMLTPSSFFMFTLVLFPIQNQLQRLLKLKLRQEYSFLASGRHLILSGLNDSLSKLNFFSFRFVISQETRWMLFSVEILKTNETAQEQVGLPSPHGQSCFSLFSQSKLGFVTEEEITALKKARF